MKKATVTLKEGFRYHRLDNSFRDVKLGEIIDADEMSPREREDRLIAKHITLAAPEPEPKTAEEK